MAKIATMYIAIILFLFSCANQTPRKPVQNTANKNKKILQIKINPQAEELSANAGLAFIDEKTKSWIYQKNSPDPIAVSLKDTISLISNYITDETFTFTIQEALKKVTPLTAASNILVSSTYNKDIEIFEKLKILHDFVALYLTFDMSMAASGQSMMTDYKAVIKSKSAVCSGYSILFKAACDAAAIPGVTCRNVIGFVKNVSVEGNKVVSRQVLHAWNIVDIQGFEYVLDTTWDSVQEKASGPISEYSVSFLFVDPRAFIFSHFPDFAEDQLMKKKLSFAGYLALPYFDISFFIKGADFFNPLNLFVENSEEYIEFQFINIKTDNVYIVVENTDTKNQEKIFPQNLNLISTFKYSFKDVGIHEFRMFMDGELLGLYYVKHNKENSDV